MTYEPKTGVIEVVSDSKDTRAILAKAFLKTFLEQDVDNPESVPLREYDLNGLKKEPDLMKVVDACDNIEDVRVTLLRLKPVEEKNYVNIESFYADEKQRSVYALAKEWFAQNNPLYKGFVVKRARIAVKFKPDSRFPQGKLLSVIITYPNGCNVNEQTEKEKLICRKYLPRWGLVKTI